MQRILLPSFMPKPLGVMGEIEDRNLTLKTLLKMLPISGLIKARSPFRCVRFHRRRMRCEGC